MDVESSPQAYPEGVGFAIGFLLGAVFGGVAWIMSHNVVIGVILFAATGTALGVVIEQTINTRPLTPRERQIALASVLLGLVLLVLVYVGVVGV
ncbi:MULTISPECIES: hypothetical protein [unclassified Haladaptatus]|uniref:hypothetical protein n=1 Tax=unclassified Haladaptatus TaxID=2622732 RepID=UPI0023E81621|nr:MULTISPECIES: hypothetical protein [unclassified Haladaptatus]